MIDRLLVRLTVLHLAITGLLATAFTREPREEEGFEIAQSMGIALLGLVVAAAFATALKALGVDVIAKIRTELGL